MADQEEPVATSPEKRAQLDDAGSTALIDDAPLVAELRHAAADAEDEVTGDAPPPLGRWALLIRRAVLIGVLPLFSAWYLIQAITIQLPDRDLLISPRAYPTAIAIAMLAVSLLVSGLELRKVLLGRRGAAAGAGAPTEGTDDDDRERITNWRDAWITLGALVVYVAVFSFLGFFLATTVFLVGVSTFFAPRKWLRNIIVSVVFSILVYLLFTELLAVRLPAGLLGFI